MKFVTFSPSSPRERRRVWERSHYKSDSKTGIQYLNSELGMCQYYISHHHNWLNVYQGYMILYLVEEKKKNQSYLRFRCICFFLLASENNHRLSSKKETHDSLSNLSDFNRTDLNPRTTQKRPTSYRDNPINSLVIVPITSKLFQRWGAQTSDLCVNSIYKVLDVGICGHHKQQCLAKFPFLHFPFSWWTSQWQQVEKIVSDYSNPSHRFQTPQWSPDITKPNVRCNLLRESWVCPGALRPAGRAWQLEQEPSRGHPCNVPRPRQPLIFDLEKLWLYTKPRLSWIPVCFHPVTSHSLGKTRIVKKKFG